MPCVFWICLVFICLSDILMSASSQDILSVWYQSAVCFSFFNTKFFKKVKMGKARRVRSSASGKASGSKVQNAVGLRQRTASGQLKKTKQQLKHKLLLQRTSSPHALCLQGVWRQASGVSCSLCRRHIASPGARLARSRAWAILGLSVD